AADPLARRRRRARGRQRRDGRAGGLRARALRRANRGPRGRHGRRGRGAQLVSKGARDRRLSGAARRSARPRSKRYQLPFLQLPLSLLVPAVQVLSFAPDELCEIEYVWFAPSLDARETAVTL